jgi:anthranilate phosphoribosyltransferase
MKQVSGVRRSLGFPTIFNALGPLCNPASAPFQLLGVGHRDLAEKMAEALRHLPVERAIVVRGEDGLDEVSLMAPTEVWQISHCSIERMRWNPEDFGMTLVDPQSLFASDPEHSAQIIRQILEGRAGPPRQIVEANAAAALWVAGAAASLRDGVAVARQAIDSGRAWKLLSDLAHLTSS